MYTYIYMYTNVCVWIHSWIISHVYNLLTVLKLGCTSKYADGNPCRLLLAWRKSSKWIHNTWMFLQWLKPKSFYYVLTIFGNKLMLQAPSNGIYTRVRQFYKRCALFRLIFWCSFPCCLIYNILQPQFLSRIFSTLWLESIFASQQISLLFLLNVAIWPKFCDSQITTWFVHQPICTPNVHVDARQNLQTGRPEFHFPQGTIWFFSAYAHVGAWHGFQPFMSINL